VNSFAVLSIAVLSNQTRSVYDLALGYIPQKARVMERFIDNSHRYYLCVCVSRVKNG